jgi:cobalt-zinc-cadmium efflux system outer membrane protein
LSLEEARSLALRRNLEFQAERQQVAIARGSLRQAGTYAFNPSADLEVFEAGQAGQPRAFTASLSQEVQWAGQWGLRRGAARANLGRAQHAANDAGRQVTMEASRAYIRALAASRRLVLAEEIRLANDRLLAATKVQLREGEISTLEENLANIEGGRALGRLLTARREAASALLDLKRVVGLPLSQEVGLADSLTVLLPSSGMDQDSLVALALERRPDVQAVTQQVRELELLTRLAGREALPNLRLSAIATRDDRESGTRYGVGVGLPLPLWNRNRGLVESRRAEADQFRLRLRAVQLRVRTEVLDAVQVYRAASEEASALESGVLIPARRNLTLLEIAYQAGKLNLPTLLLLRNQLLDAELDYWRAWETQRSAVVQLQASIAEPLVVAAGADTLSGEN